MMLAETGLSSFAIVPQNDSALRFHTPLKLKELKIYQNRTNKSTQKPDLRPENRDREI